MTDRDEALKANSDLIKCAGILATGSYCVPEHQEDYSVKVPASVLHQIRKQNDRLRSLAQRMKKATDTIRAALSGPDDADGGLGLAAIKANALAHVSFECVHNSPFQNPNTHDVGYGALKMFDYLVNNRYIASAQPKPDRIEKAYGPEKAKQFADEWYPPESKPGYVLVPVEEARESALQAAADVHGGYMNATKTRAVKTALRVFEKAMIAAAQNNPASLSTDAQNATMKQHGEPEDVLERGEECRRCGGTGTWDIGDHGPFKCDPCPVPEPKYTKEGYLIMPELYMKPKRQNEPQDDAVRGVDMDAFAQEIVKEVFDYLKSQGYQITKGAV